MPRFLTCGIAALYVIMFECLAAERMMIMAKNSSNQKATIGTPVTVDEVKISNRGKRRDLKFYEKLADVARAHPGKYVPFNPPTKSLSSLATAINRDEIPPLAGGDFHAITRKGSEIYVMYKTPAA